MCRISSRCRPKARHRGGNRRSSAGGFPPTRLASARREMPAILHTWSHLVEINMCHRARRRMRGLQPRRRLQHWRLEPANFVGSSRRTANASSKEIANMSTPETGCARHYPTLGWKTRPDRPDAGNGKRPSNAGTARSVITLPATSEWPVPTQYVTYVT